MYIVIMLVLAIFVGGVWAVRNDATFSASYNGTRFIMYVAGSIFIGATIAGYFFVLNSVLATVIEYSAPIAAIAGGLILGGSVGRKIREKVQGEV